MPPAPRCPVRGCGLSLLREERRFACASGHSFDVARAGHVNLLQPADSRARQPGDAADVVAARRRFLDAGAGAATAAVVAELVELHARPAPGEPLRVLDVGCGEGWSLRALAAAFAGRTTLDACGVDLSAAACAAAARAQRDVLFVVANADRALPWPDATFDVVLSITARRPWAEMARVLRPAGLAVVAVPAPDDLAELRDAVLGRAELDSRLSALRAEAADTFDEVEHRAARATLALTADAQRDALAVTYRGGRASREAAAAALEGGSLTVAHEVLALRRREPA